MNGTTIQLFSRRPFEFSDLAANGNALIMIAKAVDVSQYTSGTLEVRVHRENMGANAHIYVRAFTTAPSAEDPTQDFVDLNNPVASVDITAGSPNLVIDALTPNFGSMLMIITHITQSASQVTIDADLSGFLTLKSG